jgi:glycosyltransferase involved in cell wall biosynthesis
MFRSGRKVDSLKLLAEALEILHERSPDEPWLTVIGGGGPAREEALAAFSSLPRNRVRFFGLVPTEDVPAFMKGCDIFAFPGLAEPLGLVFLEAQATGLPVVAVRNEGIASVSSPDGTILLNSSRPAAYADALMELIADPERRRQMGNTALRFVAMERSRTVAQVRLAEGLAAAIEHHKLRQVSVRPSAVE